MPAYLYWLPLGAGDALAMFVSSHEALEVGTVRSNDEVRDLYHSALCVHLATDRFVIEMAPA